MNMWKPTPEGGDSRLKYSAKVTLMLGVALGPGWCPSCGPGRTEASAGPAWGRGQGAGWPVRQPPQGDPSAVTAGASFQCTMCHLGPGMSHSPTI